MGIRNLMRLQNNPLKKPDIEMFQHSPELFVTQFSMHNLCEQPHQKPKNIFEMAAISCNDDIPCFCCSRICCRWCRVRRRETESLMTRNPKLEKISKDQVGKELYMPTDMVTKVVSNDLLH